MTIRVDKIESIGFPVTSSDLAGPGGGGSSQSPPELGNIYRWHSASADTMTVVSTKVSIWNDLSGHGNDFTQSVDTNRPTLIASTSSFNSHSIVQFDGIDNFMIGLQPAITSSGITFGITFKKIDQVGLVDGIMSFHRPGTNDFDRTDAFNYNTGRDSPVTTDDEIELAGTNILLNNAAQSSAGRVIIRLAGGTVDTVRQLVNGSVGLHVTRSFGPTWDISKMEIGARNGNTQQFRGDYFEIIVYQSALSDENMSALDNYMSASFAGTLSGSVEAGPTTSSFINPSVSLDQGKLNFESFVDGAASSSATLANAPSASNPTFWIPVETPSGSGVIPVWT